MNVSEHQDPKDAAERQQASMMQAVSNALVALHKEQPNGPDCDPTVWFGTVTVDGQTLSPS